MLASSLAGKGWKPDKINVLVEAETEFTAILERLMADAQRHCVCVIRLIGNDLDRTATSDVTDADRRYIDARLCRIHTPPNVSSVRTKFAKVSAHPAMRSALHALSR